MGLESLSLSNEQSLITYPIVAPKPHTTGISEKPDALLVESVSSPSALFITPIGELLPKRVCVIDLNPPIFPFSNPVKHRLQSYTYE